MPPTVTARVDRIKFIQNRQLEVLRTSKAANLTRHMFFDCLVRIAIEKYFETKVEKSVNGAVKRLIEDEIFGRLKVKSLEKERQKKFYSREVHRLLDSNKDLLEFIFSCYQQDDLSKVKIIQRKKVINDILVGIFHLSHKTAAKIYARSKMVVAAETSKYDEYNRFKYVEFLDMICRVAVHTYRDHDEKELTFVEQVSQILDKLLQSKFLPRINPRLHF